jgi:AcrR family transcriptional regulator
MATRAPNSSKNASSPRSQYQRSDETRSRILDAALAEACEVGFQKTSVARIADRAGVAVGNLNYHFGSKQELLRRAMVSLIHDFRAQLLFALPSDSHDFFDQERSGLLTYLAYLRANPSHVRLAEEVRLHDPSLYKRSTDAWLDEFSERVTSAIEQGAIRKMTPSEIRMRGYFLLGAYQFLDRLIESRPYPGDEAVADAFLSMLRTGMGPISRENHKLSTLKDLQLEGR